MIDIEFRVIVSCDGAVDADGLREQVLKAIEAFRMEGALSAEDDEGYVQAVKVEPIVNLSVFGLGAAEFKLLSQMCQWAYAVPPGSNIDLLRPKGWSSAKTYDALINLSAAGTVGQQVAEGADAPAVVVRGDSGNDLALVGGTAWIDVPGWGTVGLETNRGHCLKVSHWWNRSTQEEPARSFEIPAVPALEDIMFSRYEDGCRSISLAKIREMQQAGSQFVARAEFSGSEAVYVEIAIYNDGPSRWERFAFEKLFGGSDLTNDEEDALYDYSGVDAATLVVEMLEGGNDEAFGDVQPLDPVIYSLPAYQPEG